MMSPETDDPAFGGSAPARTISDTCDEQIPALSSFGWDASIPGSATDLNHPPSRNFARDAANPITRMDALSDVLRVVQLTGAIYLRGAFSAPWSVISYADLAFCSACLPPTERVVSFHLV